MRIKRFPKKKKQSCRMSSSDPPPLPALNNHTFTCCCTVFRKYLDTHRTRRADARFRLTKRNVPLWVDATTLAVRYRNGLQFSKVLRGFSASASGVE
jgi:hypothetical protein